MKQSTLRQKEHRNIYESKNRLGAPDLMMDMLADEVPVCIDIYGRSTKLRDAAALAFYTDDYRFEALWNTPVRTIEAIAKRNPVAVVEPDFSIWRDDPPMMQMWALFKTRWCGRHLQGNGFKVIPSINWSDRKSFEWCFSGIPVGAPIVACEAVTCSIFQDEFNEGLAAAIETVKPGKVLVYGGGDWVMSDPRIVRFGIHGEF